MLDPDDVERRLRKHFDEVTPEEFLRIVKRTTTDSEWEELMRNRIRPSMATRVRLAIRKLLLPLRSKPAAPAQPK
jgi:hypothetical protein